MRWQWINYQGYRLRVPEGFLEWIIIKKLADGESGIEDETHRVREVTDDDGDVVERYQLKWKEDPNARLFRLGFTVSEAELIYDS